MSEIEDTRIVAFLNSIGCKVDLESTQIIASALYAWSTLPVSHNPTMTRVFIQDFAASLDRKHYFQTYEQLQQFWDIAAKHIENIHSLSKIGPALTASKRMEVKENDSCT